MSDDGTLTLKLFRSFANSVVSRPVAHIGDEHFEFHKVV